MKNSKPQRNTIKEILRESKEKGKEKKMKEKDKIEIILEDVSRMFDVILKKIQEFDERLELFEQKMVQSHKTTREVFMGMLRKEQGNSL